MPADSLNNCFHPNIGDRCGFYLNGRRSQLGKSKAVNGTVVKVEITTTTVWVTVRVAPVWNKRKSLYRVRRAALIGWAYLEDPRLAAYAHACRDVVRAARDRAANLDKADFLVAMAKVDEKRRKLA